MSKKNRSEEEIIEALRKKSGLIPEIDIDITTIEPENYYEQDKKEAEEDSLYIDEEEFDDLILEDTVTKMSKKKSKKKSIGDSNEQKE